MPLDIRTIVSHAIKAVVITGTIAPETICATGAMIAETFAVAWTT